MEALRLKLLINEILCFCSVLTEKLWLGPVAKTFDTSRCFIELTSDNIAYVFECEADNSCLEPHNGTFEISNVILLLSEMYFNISLVCHI